MKISETPLFPFFLSEQQKTELKKVLPGIENHFLDVEEYCRGFLSLKNNMTTRPAKKEIRLFLDEYIPKLEASLKANAAILKTWDDIPLHLMPWFSEGIPLLSSLEKINAELTSVKKWGKRQRDGYLTNKNRQGNPSRFLVNALADIILVITGEEPTRRNPIDVRLAPSEQSVLKDILQILDSSLHCGTCSGYIRQIIDDRKKD